MTTLEIIANIVWIICVIWMFRLHEKRMDLISQRITLAVSLIDTVGKRTDIAFQRLEIAEEYIQQHEIHLGAHHG